MPRICSLPCHWPLPWARDPSLRPSICPLSRISTAKPSRLHIKHKNVKTASEMKGFRFCVPFDFSMHNYLLRYFLAEGGVHPDKDVQIRVVPPPEMVANLKAGNVDGYLGPDPFNQRAVYENVGLHLQTVTGTFGTGILAAPSR